MTEGEHPCHATDAATGKYLKSVSDEFFPSPVLLRLETTDYSLVLFGFLTGAKSYHWIYL